MAASRSTGVCPSSHNNQTAPCRRHAPRMASAPAVRAQQRPQDSGSAATAVPSVGWLWDKKAADTHKRLKQQNIRPKKSLGQNFMLDDGVLRDIVAAAQIQPGDLVLEIGPGTGNLTRHLLAAGALVAAVEKDYALSDQLAAEFAQVPELQLICGDILRQKMPQLLASMQQHRQQCQQQQAGGGDGSSSSSGTAESSREEQQPPQDVQQAPAGGQQQQAEQQALPAVKVVANLPYYITKDCLLQMLPLGAGSGGGGGISDLYFMLQDEVGVRLTQRQPGGADWRAMNLLTQYYSRADYLFQIDRRKYLPPPKVHGAVVRFQLLPPEQRLAVPSESEFIKLVKKAFSQRRKVIRNALRPLYEPADVAAALAAAGLNQEARAQDLTLQQFGDLAWQLQGGSRQAQ